MPSFRVCLKNDRKSLNDAFGREFLSDAKISHQLTERPCIVYLGIALRREIPEALPGRLTRGYQGVPLEITESRVTTTPQSGPARPEPKKIPEKS